MSSIDNILNKYKQGNIPRNTISGSLLRESEVREATAELESLKAEAEGQKARADWLNDLFLKAHSCLATSHPKIHDLLWTAYSTPPQFDEDGIKGFVDDGA